MRGRVALAVLTQPQSQLKGKTNQVWHLKEVYHQVIKNHSTKEKLTIALPQLAQGIYVLELTTINQKSIHYKLVIKR